HRTHAGEAGQVDKRRRRLGGQGTKNLADPDACSAQRRLRLAVAAEAAEAFGVRPVLGVATCALPGDDAPRPLPATDGVVAVIERLDDVHCAGALVIDPPPLDADDGRAGSACSPPGLPVLRLSGCPTDLRGD